MYTWLLDFQSPVIVILSVFVGHPKLFVPTVLGSLGCTLLIYDIPRGLEAEIFTGQLPLPVPSTGQSTGDRDYNLQELTRHSVMLRPGSV